MFHLATSYILLFVCKDNKNINTYNKNIKNITYINVITVGMDGKVLKKILISKGFLLKDVANKLGLTQPNFSQIVKAQDVKSGTLENICDALGVKMDFFYEGTRFAPLIQEKPSVHSETMEDSDANEVKYLQGKLDAMREAYNALLNSISNSPSRSLQKVGNE